MAAQRIICGDCRDVLPTLDAASVDAVVTDPPYDLLQASRNGSGRSNEPDNPFGRHGSRGGGFMGMTWDATGVAFDPETWKAVKRVMRPGTYLLAFGGTRTFHRLACAIEDGGFEIKDTLCWLYGSGFPKHKSLLKPSWEPIILAKKRGAGTLNIDGGRIDFRSDADRAESEGKNRHTRYKNPSSNRDSYSGDMPPRIDYDGSLGRWPANLVLDEAAAALLDASVPPSVSRQGNPRSSAQSGNGWGTTHTGAEYDDEGGPSRFFYCAKASREERDKGTEGLPLRQVGMISETSGQHITRRDGGAPGPARNHHPTVKPIALMQWLVRLVARPGQTVLDPFVGSGSTLIGCDREGVHGIGIEGEAAYVDIARARVAGDSPLFAAVEVVNGP